ncbi:MAG: hypothetical protein QW815_04290 [Nitrososphaerota archaeon]
MDYMSILIFLSLHWSSITTTIRALVTEPPAKDNPSFTRWWLKEEVEKYYRLGLLGKPQMMWYEYLFHIIAYYGSPWLSLKDIPSFAPSPEEEERATKYLELKGIPKSPLLPTIDFPQDCGIVQFLMGILTPEE